MKVPQNGKVAVIGSGISGLSFTYFLNKLRPDISVTLFEATNKSGGWISQVELNDKRSNQSIRFEKGPRTLRGVSEGSLLIIDLMKQFGQQDQIQVMRSDSIANTKYLLNSQNKIIEVPHSATSFVKFFNSDLHSGLWSSILREPFSKPKKNYDDESIESFFKRRFRSTNITNNVLSAILHGIYAGDVAKLSVKSVFPSLQEMEVSNNSIVRTMIKRLYAKLTTERNKKVELSDSIKKYETLVSPKSDLEALKLSLKGMPIISFQGGLGVFPKHLEKAVLANPKNEIVYLSNITRVDPINGVITKDGQEMRFDHIRSTINVNTLAKLLSSEVLAEKCKSVEYVSIFMANVFSPQSNLLKQHGFGFLVPKSTRSAGFLLGTIFDSDLKNYSQALYGPTQANTPEQGDNITLMFGGHFFKDGGIPSADVMISAVRNTLHKILGVETDNLIVRDEATASDASVDLEKNQILVSYNLHQDCIPQYNVGYEALKEDVQQLIADWKFSFGGVCFAKGIGVPDCVMNALEDALKITK